MAVEEIEITQETLQSQSAYCPATIFMLGARLEYLDDAIRKVDRDKHLCLGSILGSTPPVWLHKDGFFIGRWMVTNGDYRRFMMFADTDDDGNLSRMFDDPGLWEHIWSGRNFRIKNLKITYKVDDETDMMIENYEGASSFVEAYLLSIRYEVERLLSGEEEGDVDLDLIESLFEYARVRLWDMLDEDEDAEDGALMAADQAIASIDRVIDTLYRQYALNVDARYKQALRARNLPVETILFLKRFKDALKREIKKGTGSGPIPIHQVIYPRYWEKATGMKKSRFGGARFGSGNVPWEQQPVYGLTLYEALAYTTWLGQQTDLNVTLPDEADFERAAGWPLEGLPPNEDQVILDPFKKAIFPWYMPGVTREFRDYNYFFGQEGRTLKEFYFHNDREYRKLLEDTAKTSPDGQHIYQMVGFGWQWTLDRYDPTVHKYINFDEFNYPVCRTPVCRFEPGGDNLPVFEYKPNSNMSNSFFVARGAPDIIGGPGTVTRRFSMYPLRGHENVGFRFVFRQN